MRCVAGLPPERGCLDRRQRTRRRFRRDAYDTRATPGVLASPAGSPAPRSGPFPITVHLRFRER